MKCGMIWKKYRRYDAESGRCSGRSGEYVGRIDMCNGISWEYDGSGGNSGESREYGGRFIVEEELGVVVESVRCKVLMSDRAKGQ